MLKIDYTTSKGRGVFATCFIPAGQIIEDAPVIVIPPEQMSLIKGTVLFEYYFRWKLEGQETCAICLGNGSIYNHSTHHANAHYIRRYETHSIRFIAARDIHPGEEIMTNYNGDVDCRRAMWFEESPQTTSNQILSAPSTRAS
ncbi:MAG: SET domain-containing protein [Betaproteobacteria bacterium]|nr:SET domain-containing protein [Betaproteobacteria bacterium]